MTENIYISLEQIKAHLNINEDYHDDDFYLMQLADTAIAAIENRIDNKIDRYVHDSVLEPPLVHAALLLIGTWYLQRETITIGHGVQEVPHTIDFLLQPYILYTNCPYAIRRI